MRKYTRQSIILDLIENHEIETQEELADHLLKKGIQITQATISRDIKELRLVKVLTTNKKYKYATIDNQYEGTSERLIRIFKSSVLSIERAENIIVIKTLPGAARICASTVDNLKFNGIVGTIAGYDTIFIAMEKMNMINSLLENLQNLLK
ncbi:Arginine repressor [[Clostridium] ultunense Esp]|uniref:Arginine repressor n=1 Tax=[Clostridium] ultunense Esp TaxID=1288971 RepID=M1ZBZ3_9FIRM|nr:arginine repressor [Schnuerera ultunensis]CCQ96011.1 Arginine repressor [[Clostridium] ultunense Esp]SHD77152.1 transcriptional regulator (AhrC-arginine) [[Clostridium] ultunense Esp]